MLKLLCALANDLYTLKSCLHHCSAVKRPSLYNMFLRNTTHSYSKKDNKVECHSALISEKDAQKCHKDNKNSCSHKI